VSTLTCHYVAAGVPPAARVRTLTLLRRETEMSLKWIAARLRMGCWTYLSNLLNAEVKPTSAHQGLLPLSQQSEVTLAGP
jgi:hypothetical protein